MSEFPQENSEPNSLETRPIGRLLLEYSIPAILGMTIVAINQIISTIFIGYGIGSDGIAAMGITFPLSNLLIAFCQIAGTGGPSVCSLEMGRKNIRLAEHTLGQILTVQIATGLFFGITSYVFLTPLLLLFGASTQTLPLAYDYMLWTVLSTPISFVMIALNNSARSSGYPSKALFTSLLCTIINTFLTPLFIFKLHWGMQGAGAALAIAQSAGVLWLLAHFCRSSSALSFRRNTFFPEFAIIRSIVSIGMSPFLLNAGSCLVVILLNRALVTHGGDNAVGAFGIINRVIMLFSMSCVGLGQAMQPIVGYNHGAGRPDRVREALLKTVLTASAFTAIGFLASERCPQLLVKLFTDHDGLTALSIHGLRLCNAALFLVGSQMVTAVYYQSIGRAPLAMLLSLCRQFLFLTPCLLYLPTRFGLEGVWYSLPASDSAAFFVTLLVFALNHRELMPIAGQQQTNKP